VADDRHDRRPAGHPVAAGHRPAAEAQPHRTAAGGGGLDRRAAVRGAGAVDAADLVPQRERRRHQPAVAVRAAEPGGLRELLLNSITASVLSTALVLVLAIPAAYALSIRPVRKWTDVMFFFLSTKMLPVVAGLLPVYLIAQGIGMLDNIWLLIILYTSMNLPIAVWMMRSFLAEVPGEVLEAASLDGCSLPRTLRTIVIPMVAPGIAATSLICFIFSWNELLFARVLTATVAQTAPVFLTSFVTSQGLFLAKVCAAAVVVSLPVLIAGFAAQDKLVQGLSLGAIK
jgi:sorbitol/mannitol transport system permease protein